MPVYESQPTPEGYTGNVPKTYELIPEDTVLEATVLKVEDDVKPFNNRDTGEPVVKVAFTFQTSYEDQERKVWGEVWPEFYPHPDCQLHAWTQEILGVELPNDFVLNTDDLEGESCRVIMGVRSYVKKATQEKKTVNFVKDVLRSSTPAMAGASTPGTGTYEEPF